MKNSLKRIVLAVVLIAVMVLTCSCAHRVGNRITYGLDVQTFHYAYVYCGGDKIAEGCVTQWRDYDNSEAVQVQINGKYYLTQYSNVVLVADPALGGMQYADVNNAWDGVIE